MNSAGRELGWMGRMGRLSPPSGGRGARAVARLADDITEELEVATAAAA